MSEGEKNRLTDDEIALVLGGMAETRGDDFYDPLLAYFCPTYNIENKL